MSTPFKMKGSPFQRNFGVSPVKQDKRKGKMPITPPDFKPPIGKMPTPNVFKAPIGKTPTIQPQEFAVPGGPNRKPPTGHQNTKTKKSKHSYTLKKTETRVKK